MAWLVAGALLLCVEFCRPGWVVFGVGGGRLFAGSRDAALLVTLKPGSYTAQVKATQVTSSGVALIEIYEVP